MTRNKSLRLLVPFSLMALFGCNTGGIAGSTAVEEVAVQSHADATKVVSVEDSLPKPPRYSPFLIDHKTLSPFASVPPDDDATPTPAPKPSATPSASPGPSPTGSASPGASASPSLPLDYANGTFVASLLAGGGSPGTPKDGTGGAAVFGTDGSSVGIALNFEKSPPDNLGLTDSAANQLRKAALTGGQVSLIAGDAGNSSSKDDNSFKDPGGACFNALQKVFYVADSGHHRIAQVNPTTNAITWIAGSPTLAGVPATPAIKDGKGSGVAADQLAVFNNPRGLAFKPSTTVVYIADTGFNCIRALDLSKTPSEVTTIAGSATGASGKPADVGTAEDALATKFNAPSALALSTDEKTLYVADTGNHCIRAIDVAAAAAGKVRVVAGTLAPDNKDGTGTGASFISPCALAADKTTLFVGEQGTPRIRVVDMATSRVTTALGLATAGKVEGDKTKAAFTKVTGLGALLDDSGKLTTLYAYDAGDTTNGPRLLSIKP
jgi:sugar lactone lactonase YvrE